MDKLTEAINAVDLPAIVADLFPDSGARPGKQSLINASWRGDEKPSFSLYRSRENNIWMYRDHATGERGTAFHFLVNHGDMDAQKAATYIMKRAGVSIGGTHGPAHFPRNHRANSGTNSNRPSVASKDTDESNGSTVDVCTSIPISDDVLWDITNDLGWGLTNEMRGRGFTERDVADYEFYSGKNGKDAVFLIKDPRGVTVSVKSRIHGAVKTNRYKYEIKGHGVPAWCSPKFQESRNVLLVEGELNAAIAHSVILEFKNQNFACMGMGGAENHPHGWALEDKRVFIYADDDPSGNDAKLKWTAVAKEYHAESISIMPALDGKDFCDIAGGEGRKALLYTLSDLFKGAVKVHSPLDRQIGYYTISEIVDSGMRYLSGEILVPMGYWELDSYTRGLHESGIVLTAALPSMGKSVMLRDMLSHHVNINPSHKILLFTPDQSVPSVLRLITNKRSGIPGWRIQTRQFTNAMLDQYGSPEGAIRHWKEVFADTVIHYSKRFIISETQYMPDVIREAERALDDGVTMFGGDYIQMFEMETQQGEESETKAIREFKAKVREWKVTFIFATQLAKYKFSQNRKSGIPVSTDIEGTGKIFQNAEQCFMIYNYDLYTKEHKEEEVDGLGEYTTTNEGTTHSLARVYVRKNKEGKTHDFRYLVWDAEVPTFRSMATEDITSQGISSKPRKVPLDGPISRKQETTN